MSTAVRVYYIEDNILKLVKADAVLRENPTSASDVTESPVEEGSPATDNVRDKEDRVTLELYVTNTPTEVPSSHAEGVSGAVRADEGGASVLQFDAPFDRRKELYADLQRVRKLALRFSMESEIRSYEDFVIETIALDRDARSGSGSKIVLGMKRLRIVSTRIVAVPQRLRRTRQPIPRGNQPVQPPREGLAHRAVRGLGLIGGS